ncbi:hypothetical protein M9H77_28308 [Catharanthus roseus]|uniref:Uncharacterized protein n=1 Tax=Catharanthus roseus TaxID=4058 RepID=A0ACC0AF70_CATRO|nr:hypothetical protein M9H77_28308 [Catharanthus roseus]
MTGKRRDRDYRHMVKLYSLTKDKSILGIRYNLFKKLSDEGQTPHNQNNMLWKALTKVKTDRRIILFGTPFQNNFDVQYNTFCQVNPKMYLLRLDKFKAMMEPFVHVHKVTILQENLPSLSDTLVVLTPTDLQKKLLERIYDNVFEKVYLLSLISAHPSLGVEHEAFSNHKSILEELKMSLEGG